MAEENNLIASTVQKWVNSSCNSWATKQRLSKLQYFIESAAWQSIGANPSLHIPPGMILLSQVLWALCNRINYCLSTNIVANCSTSLLISLENSAETPLHKRCKGEGKSYTIGWSKKWQLPNWGIEPTAASIFKRFELGEPVLTIRARSAIPTVYLRNSRFKLFTIVIREGVL